MTSADAGMGSVGTPSSVSTAFLLSPNYRGLIFDDRPEVVVEAPVGASVTVTDGVSGSPVAVTTVPAGATSVTLSAGTLTLNHPYTVTVTSGGAQLAQWDVTPVPASQRDSMNISFDAKGRLLMHGVPRFGLGVYDSGLGYTTSAASWEQMLFAPGGPRGLGALPLNLYLNYHYGAAPLTAMLPMMDVLEQHGMMYLQTGNCFEAGSHKRLPFAIDQSDSYVTQFGAHPAAAGYYIMDECVDALVPETTEHYTRLRGLDRDSMTLATTLARGYIDPRKWVNATDIVGTDPYPLFGPEPSQGYAHFQVADFTAFAKAAVRDTRPIFSVLQFFKFTSDSRWPTAAEQRAHAVMSIVEGARGLFWWELGQGGLRQSDAATVATQMANLTTLVRELSALEPALVADDVPGALVGNSTRYSDALAGRKAQLEHNIAVDWLFSNKDFWREELTRLNAGDVSRSPMLLGAATVRTKVKIANGTGYVFAYNYTNQSTPVTFTWHTAPGTVTENRSGQTLPLSGNSWSDTFGAYEARIYVIASGGSGGTTVAPSGLAVSFSNPANGATVGGATTITVAAAGATSPTYQLAVDGTTLSVGSSPTTVWNTTTATNGAHTLTATVTDITGATASASITVTVSNTTAAAPQPAATTSFTASFAYPASGATVGGSQTVGMATTATWGQSKTFTLSVDGTTITSQTLTGTTLWVTWDTRGVSNGTRTLTLAVAFNGQTATTTLPVTVSNAGAPTSPPATPLSASFTAPAGGAAATGTVSVQMAASGAPAGTTTFALAIDGTIVSTQSVTGTTASYSWNTTAASDGPHALVLTVTDSSGRTAGATRTVTVSNTSPPISSLLVPELPRVFLDTTLVTPTGQTIAVPAGGSFQAALNAAQPGDVITLQAGATYQGPFTLPNKAGTGWITIRTSAPDSSLPAPGTRVTPAHATVMPKITVAGNVGGAIQTATGAHHFRFIGVEVRPVGANVWALVELGNGGESSLASQPHNIVIDRCYIHGNPGVATVRGVALNGRSLAVIDSHLAEFKDNNFDTQAIIGWSGAGPFKITNNYLEAAGENIMFGGGDPSIANLVPSDIEIRQNYFFKPTSWRGVWAAVKNLFELKNARRVLVEGNIFENNWLAAQSGWAIQFTVRNQDGAAPWSTIEDVTFQRNIVRHAGSGLNILAADDPNPSQTMKRVLIRDNVFDDISGARWGGFGRLFQVLGYAAGSTDLVIEHNTAFQQENVGYAEGVTHSGFVFRNNIAPRGSGFGFVGNGAAEGTGTLNRYFPAAVFSRNVLPGANSALYPANNFFPASIDAVGFVDRAAGNYRLGPTSAYRSAATDGTDIGANIAAVEAATIGVINGTGQ